MSTAYHCRTDPPPTVIAVAGVVLWRTFGIAYMGDTGSWYLRSRVRKPNEMPTAAAFHTAELYAISAVAAHHSGPLEILCDCPVVVEFVRDWQAGRTPPPVPGYRGNRLHGLGPTMLARRTTLTVRWVQGRTGHPLIKRAGELARLASRVGVDRLGPSQIRSRAMDIARESVLAAS